MGYLDALSYKYNLQIKIEGMRMLLQNKENTICGKQKCFNTRGYFDPELPYDNAYLNAKVEVFQKYREKQAPLRVMDILASNKQLQVQRNLILLHCKNNLVETSKKKASSNIKTSRNNLDSQKNASKKLLPLVCDKRVKIIWKNYLQRKQIVEDKENVKFKAVSTISTRINTEAVACRKYSSCTSHSSIREGISSQAKILKIFDDSEPIRYK